MASKSRKSSKNKETEERDERDDENRDTPKEEDNEETEPIETKPKAPRKSKTKSPRKKEDNEEAPKGRGKAKAKPRASRKKEENEDEEEKPKRKGKKESPKNAVAKQKEKSGIKSPRKSKKKEKSESSSDGEQEIQLNKDGKKVKEKKVILYEKGDQPRHAAKLASLLANQLFNDPEEARIMYFLVDRSPMGSGKSPIQIWLAQKFNLPMLIVAPNKIVANNWRTECAKYNVPIVHIKGKPAIFTYNDLKGTASAKGNSYIPPSGLLERNLTMKLKKKGKLTKTRKQEAQEIEINPYSPTRRLLKILRKGCLIVFDEAQVLKNANLTSMAVQKIIDVVYELRRYTEDYLVKRKVKKGIDEDDAREEAFDELKSVGDDEFENTRFSLLSGTLFDKTENLFVILKVLRIIRESRLIIRNPKTGLSKLAGAQEIIDYAAGWDTEKTQLIINKYGRKLYDGAECKQAMFELYDSVIQPAISSAMPKIDIVDKRNLFVFLTVDEIKITNRGIALFKKAINYNVKTNTVDDGKQDVGGIGGAMAMVEAGMAGAFVRLTHRFLDAHPTKKITIFYQYNVAKEMMIRGLSKYKPIVIAGLAKKGNRTLLEEQRDKDIAKFQEPNSIHRVAIVSYLVGSKGINLDDKVGGFVRNGLQMPTPRIIDQLQAASRIGRIDTVFDPEDESTIPRSYVVWPANTDALIRIMDAAVTKSTVLKTTTRTETGIAPRLPSEYPAEEETQPEDENMYPPKTSEMARRLIEQAENEITVFKEKGLSSKEIIREYIASPENSEEEDEGDGDESEEDGENDETPKKTSKSPRRKPPARRKKAAATKLADESDKE